MASVAKFVESGSRLRAIASVSGVLPEAAMRFLDWRDNDQDWSDITSPMIPVVPTASRAR
jgi:hypothetical protein